MKKGNIVTNLYSSDTNKPTLGLAGRIGSINIDENGADGKRHILFTEHDGVTFSGFISTPLHQNYTDISNSANLPTMQALSNDFLV